MERAVPILPADDLGVAKRFYTGLGFAVTFEATTDGKSGIMGVAASAGRAWPAMAVMRAFRC